MSSGRWGVGAGGVAALVECHHPVAVRGRRLDLPLPHQPCLREAVQQRRVALGRPAAIASNAPAPVEMLS
ncbi:hypothetical protein [Streptomyces collinus]|uniref:hypothetical protein n=1 Tax=Streptomyces collinus TaxID=42684 RepID=UPI0037A419ED